MKHSESQMLIECGSATHLEKNRIFETILVVFKNITLSVTIR